MDWRDLRRMDRVWVEQIDPANLDASRGELVGVDLAKSSIKAAYYSDTRTSAKIVVVGGNWIRGSFLRVHHEIPEWDFDEVLGTYLVTNDDSVRQSGAWVTTLDCQSILYGLSTDVAASPWVLGSNSYALTAAHQMLSNIGREYVDRTPNDYMIRGAKLLDSGTSVLSRLFALCEVCDNRLDVDDFGRVVFEPYIAPSAKSPSFELDLADPRGIVISDVSRSSDWLRTPNRAVIVYRFTEGDVEKTVFGQADATGASSPTVRGYVITDYREVDELTPATAYAAQLMAKSKLETSSLESVEYSLSTTYFPTWAGDVIDLVIDDGEEAYQGRRRCLVKSLEMDLQYLTLKLALKELSHEEDIWT